MTDDIETTPTAVYIVSSGNYEQECITGLYTSRELAEQEAEPDARIEEHRLFDRPQRILLFYSANLWMRPDGSLYTKESSYEQPESSWREGLPAVAESWGLDGSESPPIGRWLKDHPERLRWDRAQVAKSGRSVAASDRPVAGAEGYDKTSVMARLDELRALARATIDSALADIVA